jgi:TolB protein
MARTVLLSATVVVALVAACGAALLVASMKPAEAAFPGDNGSIVFPGTKVVDEPDTGAVYHKGLYRMGPDGGGVKRLVEGAYVASPEYSADGSKLVWTEDTCQVEREECDTLFVANADGTDQHPLPAIVPGAHAELPHNLYPSWFPSGRKIIFAADPFGGETITKAALFVVPVDKNGYATGPPTQWTDPNRHGFFEWQPAVSPDGSKIAFASDRNGDALEIYVMDANRPEGPDNPLLQLTDNEVRDSAPDWSPDGKRIVYESRNGFDYEVMVMNADGTSKKNLSRDPDEDQHSPAFSPNGRKILYSSGSKVWKMRTDGTAKVLLNGPDVWGGVPDWRPRP